jgi:hypothetical protein
MPADVLRRPDHSRRPGVENPKFIRTGWTGQDNPARFPVGVSGLTDG